MKGFLHFHPLSLFLYFIFVLVVTMFCRNTVLILISLLGAALFALSLGVKIGFSYLIIFLLTVLTNPIFNHNGTTVILFLNGYQLTLESIIYGINLGLMIVATLIWFSCYNAVMTYDKVICLFGKVAPRLAIVFSMALRYIPCFITTGKKIIKIQGLITDFGGGAFKRIKKYTSVLSCLTTYSLEGAVEQANSMRARGYGENKIVSYSRFCFALGDIIFILVILVGFVYIFAFSGMMNFNPYPRIEGPTCFFPYFIAILYFFIPLLINLWSDLKWKFCVSKI